MKNITLITLAVTTLAAISLNSCGIYDPEYQAWKKQKAGAAPTANNPYGAPEAGSNPYGTPHAGGEPSTTRAATADGNAPYQPLPGIAQPDSYPESPAAGTQSNTAAASISHTVVSGDSLWSLSRKHGTTIEAIQSANGLSNTNIRTGQILTIPSR
jgi:nucleoid-associated protein YgaU